jgi:hypothetical protein
MFETMRYAVVKTDKYIQRGGRTAIESIEEKSGHRILAHQTHKGNFLSVSINLKLCNVAFSKVYYYFYCNKMFIVIMRQLS